MLSVLYEKNGWFQAMLTAVEVSMPAFSSASAPASPPSFPEHAASARALTATAAVSADLRVDLKVPPTGFGGAPSISTSAVHAARCATHGWCERTAVKWGHSGTSHRRMVIVTHSIRRRPARLLRAGGTGPTARRDSSPSGGSRPAVVLRRALPRHVGGRPGVNNGSFPGAR